MLGVEQGKGQAGGPGGFTSGASGDPGAGDTAGAGDVVGVGGDGTSAGGGSGATPALGGSGGSANGGTSAGGASARGGSVGMGGSGATATGGTAGDVLGGAAGDQGLAGDMGSGGTGGGTGGGAGGGSAGSGGTIGGSSGTGTGGFAGASSLGDCQSQTYGGHSYVFCNVKLPWADARDSCASIGMQLVRVDDAAENDFLAANFYSSPPLQGMWLSASDSAVEGEWRWLNGDLFWLGDKAGTPQNGLYNAWYVGTQPVANMSTRDCALFDLGADFGWYDSNCTVAAVYVCESL